MEWNTTDFMLEDKGAFFNTLNDVLFSFLYKLLLYRST